MNFLFTTFRFGYRLNRLILFDRIFPDGRNASTPCYAVGGAADVAVCNGDPWSWPTEGSTFAKQYVARGFQQSHQL